MALTETFARTLIDAELADQGWTISEHVRVRQKPPSVPTAESIDRPARGTRPEIGQPAGNRMRRTASPCIVPWLQPAVPP